MTGLPPGLAWNGMQVTGVATAVGTSTLTVTAIDARGFGQTSQPALQVVAGNYTITDQGKGTITAVGDHYLYVGAKLILWDARTRLAKILDKRIISKGRVQLNLLFGANVIADNTYKPKDSVVLNLDETEGKKRFAIVDINSPQGALVPLKSVEWRTTSPGLSESIASSSSP
jgi:hypothetical protein